MTSRPITANEARDLAAELVYELFPHIGDPEGISDVALRWSDETGTDFALVCMAAVQLIFTDHFKNISHEAPKET